MKPASEEYPPVQVLTIRKLQGLLEQRLRELRAAGIPYEVFDLDTVPDMDLGDGQDGGP